MTTRRLSILFGTALTVALGAAALTACDEQAEPPPQDDQALETDAAEQLEPLSDIEIERALKREIAYDHSIPSAYFAVEVNAGVAELKGRVDTLLARSARRPSPSPCEACVRSRTGCASTPRIEAMPH